MRHKQSDEFIKLYKKMAARHGYSGIWNDFIQIFACSLSNAIDKSRKEQRMKSVEDVMRVYNQEELALFVKMMELTSIAIKEEPDQDFLGELYHALELHKKQVGQFFTPYNVSKMMALMNLRDPSEEIREKGFISINDPCCGGGAMLIAAANVCREKDIDIGKDILFVAQDLDPLVAKMCYIQLCLLGCAGYVLIGNSLFSEEVQESNTWLLPKLFQQAWLDRGVIYKPDASA